MGSLVGLHFHFVLNVFFVKGSLGKIMVHLGRSMCDLQNSWILVRKTNSPSIYGHSNMTLQSLMIRTIARCFLFLLVISGCLSYLPHNALLCSGYCCYYYQCCCLLAFDVVAVLTTCLSWLYSIWGNVRCVLTRATILNETLKTAVDLRTLPNTHKRVPAIMQPCDLKKWGPTQP